MRFRTLLSGVYRWSALHSRAIAFFGGLGIVSLWTVLRHITNGVNFDVVGQVGMAEQWSNGDRGGAQVGSTNYLLKMPLYWLVDHLGFLSPHGKLLLLALVCNIATFALIFIILKKLLALYRVKTHSWLYLGFLWLAVIGGNVYWLDYANSRNLETASGLLFLYLVLRFLERSSLKNAVLAAGCGAVVFFADPLQVFVIALPICLYVVGRWLVSRSKDYSVKAASVIALTLAGYAVSKLLFWLSTLVLPVSYLKIPGGLLSLSWANISTTLHQTLTNTLKIFGADFLKRPFGANTIREFLGFVVLLGTVMLVIVVLKLRLGAPKGILVTILATNYLVYMASGQALQWETSRYLVMVPLVCLMLLSIYGESVAGNFARGIKTAWLLIIVGGVVLIAGALATDWPGRYSKDVYITYVAQFLQQQNYPYAISSRQVAIPTSYFTDYHYTVVPFICSSDGHLHFSNLFFDQAPLQKLHSATKIPIIIQNTGVQSGPFFCSKDDILAQFGTPSQELSVPGGSLAEIYNSTNLHITN